MHYFQFIRRYNTWDMKQRAERLSEEARRTAMYVPLFCIWSPLTPRSVYGRLEALGHDRQDMRWDEDTDWGKLFTEGGEVNETCTRSSISPCWPPFHRCVARLAEVVTAFVGTRDRKLAGSKNGRRALRTSRGSIHRIHAAP